MKGRQTFWVGAVAVVAIAAVFGAVVLRRGLSADARPGVVETAIARRLVVLSVGHAARAASNPRGGDPDAWRAGAAPFAEHCAMCHGQDGRGESGIAHSMYPPVPDLADGDIQRMNDGTLFAIIRHGVRWTGMPAFGSAHSDEEIWQLVSFVRHIPRLEPAERAARASHGHTARPETHPDGPERTGVEMDGTTFTPGELHVKVGDVVTWSNKDPFPHNVTSAAGGFRSGDLQPDQRWRFRANEAGRFPYVCTLHPGMSGTLVVTR